MDLEVVAQVIAYAAVGLTVLVGGFLVLDLLTPGSLGQLVMDRNPNAAVLSSGILVALGLVLWFAIFFSDVGWDGLDDAAVYGAIGVAAQAAGFLVLDLLIPGRLGGIVEEPRLHPAAFFAAAGQLAVALVVCASLS